MLLTFFFLFYQTIISLGSDCQIAQVLRECGLRQEAYPFDWVIAEDFESITRAIEDHFQYWLDPNFLEYRGNAIYNNYYKMNFVHDFPHLSNKKTSDEGDYSSFGQIDAHWRNYLSQAREKFDRRIERLYQVLNSSSPVCFLRAYATQHEAERFSNLMREKYPQLPFTLLVVRRAGLLNLDWNIPNVKVFYLKNENDAAYPWWWKANSWKTIFKSQGLM